MSADGVKTRFNCRNRWLRHVLLGTVLVAFFLTMLFVYHKAAWMIINNADSASIVLEGQDLLRGNWNLAGWSLPPDSFWLTDILFYTVAVKLFGLQTSVMKDVPSLIFALIVACSVWLAVRPFRGRSAAIAGLGTFTLLGLPSAQTSVPLIRLVLIGPIHMGTILFVLLSLALLDEVRRAQIDGRSHLRRSLMFGGIALILLAMALVGDVFAFWVFVLPVLISAAASVFRRGLSRETVVTTSWVAAAIVFAEVIAAAVRSSGGFASQPLEARFVSWTRLPENFGLMARGVFGLFGADFFDQPVGSLETLLILFHTGTLAFSLWAMVRTARDWWRGVEEPDWVESILLLACAFDALAFLFSSVASNLATTRYLMPIPLFSSVIGGRFLARLTFTEAKQRQLFIGAATVVVVASVVSFGLIFRGPIPASEERHLADWLVQNNLRHGFGRFWESSIVTVESRGLVTVSPVIEHNGHLTAFRWLSSASWYDSSAQSPRNDPHGEDGAQVTFVVWKTTSNGDPTFGINEETAIRTFGPPSDQKQVGSFRVLVWNNDLRPLLAP